MLRPGYSLIAALLLALAGPALTADPPDASQSMVFIRVVADVTIDFGGLKEAIERKDVELATGSGFLVAPSGLVLTSHHVVAEDEVPFKKRAGDDAEVRIGNRRIEALVPGEGGRGC